MNLIVAVDKNWAIGKDNKLLVSIPSDMKYFRETTKDKVVAMGRKTLESFPGEKPLPNRTNVVLTANRSYQKEGVIVVHSIEEMVEELKKYSADDVYIIGGEMVYREMLPYCTEAYITIIDHSYDADTYFPNLDEDPQWKRTGVSDEQTYFDLEYVYTIYERVK